MINRAKNIKTKELIEFVKLYDNLGDQNIKINNVLAEESKKKPIKKSADRTRNIIKLELASKIFMI